MKAIAKTQLSLAIALIVASSAAAYAAGPDGASSQFSNVNSSVSTITDATGATTDGASTTTGVNPAALARASHKLSAAIDIINRFNDEANSQGLDQNWRYGMIANLMKGDEANFAAAFYAPNLDQARIAAQEIAAMSIATPRNAKAMPTATKHAAGTAQSTGFGDPTNDLVYVPLSPCRILDTRAGTILAAGSVHDYSYTSVNVGASACPVAAANPSGVIPAALAINATVVAGSFSGVSAYLAIYPQGTTQSTSFLNYGPGDIKANAGIVSINQDNGVFEVFNQEATNLIIDVFGLFTVPGNVTSASGAYATALGQGTSASGDSSVATGFATVASGPNSTATGYFTTAAGSDSTAMGHFSVANAGAPFSTAMGYQAETNAPAAMALGNHVQANGDSSVAMGYYTVAGAARATAMGDSTVASAGGATAMGSGTVASGGEATAMGASTAASGAFSTAMGASTQAQGAASTSMGKQTVASGDYSTTMGYLNAASGYISTAMGYNNTASGNSSFAAGQSNTASGTGSVALGTRAVAQQDYSFVFNGKTDTTFYASNSTGSFNVSTPSGGGITFVQAGQDCYMNNSTSGWNCSSDRNLKTAIVPTDGRDVLAKLVAMPVSNWEWKTDGAQGHKHLGPMAQDFKAAFNLGGDDDKAISSTDAQGVALAAIKGLHAELMDRDARLAAQAERIDALRIEKDYQIAELSSNLAAQQQRVAQLEALAGDIEQIKAQLAAYRREAQPAIGVGTASW
jgi:hypothetical protein